MPRIGVVSFLNSRPLIEGLDADPNVRLVLDVPAALPGRLDSGEFDAALIPIIDVIRSDGRLSVVSDACIGCDGETMTVRVFSQVPPHKVRRLHVDGDSHTSVALARVIWREWFDVDLEIVPIDARRDPLAACESVLLIGDKVVDPRRGSFAYEVDLGGAWRQHTGLPFVFAVWAAGSNELRIASNELPETRSFAESQLARRTSHLAALLSSARDRGVARVAEIARQQGPALGWPPELAERYLCRCLSYTIDERYAAGAERFAELCEKLGLASSHKIDWRDALPATAR